jgi:glycosyltransferase involved in cell wall biosynthesis
MSFRLSVIMPVFNEARTLLNILGRVEAVPIAKELLIVDDGSSDGTRELLKNLPPAAAQTARKIIFQEKNQGKGACIRAGIAAAQGDYIIVQDADLEYDPADFPALLAPLLNGTADVVYGSRYMAGARNNSPYWHRCVNKFLTGFSNLLTGYSLTDMETCYKVFRADLLKSIPLRSNRFGFEPEVTAKIAKKGARIVEVPISYHGRTQKEGKKINWKDGVAAMATIVKYSLINERSK